MKKRRVMWIAIFSILAILTGVGFIVTVNFYLLAMFIVSIVSAIILAVTHN